MKKYRVNVNGSLYEIEIEEMDASAAKRAPAAAPAPAPAVKPAAAPVGAGTKVNAPMPGTILDVKVQAGQSVKRGQVLVILEAMKMENEIQAPCDGKITGVNVRKGDSVETAALLCTIA
ncbi:MAG: biotin/lipoyl-containing protein [Candidatus Faecousia sp.]|uniref:biotin/lipoyl-containing protein n=1 Tax=Faecousia sp. TaxID=2952921 RepID=UPI002A8C85CD|nr:biotin/lipoyl-containing protein [Candidatus Faecousia sp.]